MVASHIFFIIGTITYKDFGISVDEWELRILGIQNLKYALKTLLEIEVTYFDKLVETYQIDDHYGTHGPVF